MSHSGLLKFIINSVKTKTIIIMVTILMLMLSIDSVMTMNRYLKQEKESLRELGQFFVEAHAEHISSYSPSNYLEEFKEIIPAIQKEPNIQKAELFTTDKESLYSHMFIEETTAPSITVTKPIINKKTQKEEAFLTLTFSEKSMHQKRYKEEQYVLFSLLVMTLILGVTCFIVIEIFINRPLKQLTQAMHHLSEGDTSYKIKGKTKHDEFGLMARAIDELEKQLDFKQKTAKNQQELEDMMQAESKMRITHLTEEMSSKASNLTFNMSKVSSATAELSSSVDEITSKMAHSRDITHSAVKEAARNNKTIEELKEAAERVDDIIKLIESIADQTSLLALNATIEASRAGEAGRGFAVVADEVKKLSSRTADATRNISAQVELMKNSSQDAVKAMERIQTDVHNIDELITEVTESVNEQKLATEDIAQNMHEATEETTYVADKLSDIKNFNV